MPSTDEQILREFQALHAPDSQVRALSEARLPNDSEPFDPDQSAQRFAVHAQSRVQAYFASVDTLLERSGKE